ncbi:Protein kinase PINOID [Stylosanthes scabra]|uniref:non-specific serine/threonine protein kinase n=1 Tax=Stylosanthes scabra TaxID=79078 RepID=A0ABU6T4J7_9FABA|nr:Protein kinase PINOID [Stylosanthes scabra]
MSDLSDNSRCRHNFHGVDHNHRPHRASQAASQAMKNLCAQHGGQLRLGHFRLLRLLGSGDIGKVFLCEISKSLKPHSNCYYAMKVVDRKSLALKKKLKRAEMEEQVLSVIDHPFLPTLHAKFEAREYTCFVMDYCPGGDLFTLQQNQPDLRFTVSTARFFAAEVLVALEYLHMMGIVYRDLKPENVLIQEDGHIMLTDFDLSLHLEVHPMLLKQVSINRIMKKKNKPMLCCGESYDYEHIARGRNRKKASINIIGGNGHAQEIEVSAEPVNGRSHSFVGTHEYLAPEVILGLGHGSAVDWWAFGVFLYELLYGYTPFKDASSNEKTMNNILRKRLSFPRPGTKTHSGQEIAKAEDLIGKLLIKNPKRRMGYNSGSCEIKKHEFFQGINWALIRSAKPPLLPRNPHQQKRNSFDMPKPSFKNKPVSQRPGQIPFF